MGHARRIYEDLAKIKTAGSGLAPQPGTYV